MLKLVLTLRVGLEEMATFPEHCLAFNLHGGYKMHLEIIFLENYVFPKSTNCAWRKAVVDGKQLNSIWS